VLFVVSETLSDAFLFNPRWCILIRSSQIADHISTVHERLISWYLQSFGHRKWPVLFSIAFTICRWSFMRSCVKRQRNPRHHSLTRFPYLVWRKRPHKLDPSHLDFCEKSVFVSLWRLEMHGAESCCAFLMLAQVNCEWFKFDINWNRTYLAWDELPDMPRCLFYILSWIRDPCDPGRSSPRQTRRFPT
jgi:hypothetical protein